MGHNAVIMACFDGAHLVVKSTDEGVLDSVESAIGQFAPHAPHSHKRYRHERWFVYGHLPRHVQEGMSDRRSASLWWLLGLLIAEGWEVLEVDLYEFSLRKELD
jgi:hypothetical protein